MRMALVVALALAVLGCTGGHPGVREPHALIETPRAVATEAVWVELTPLAEFPSDSDYGANLAAAQRAARAWSEPFRDPEGVLTPAMRESLLEQLAAHAAVRAQRTPDAYLALAEREPPTEWLDVRESCFAGSYEELFGEPAPGVSSRPHFERAWDRAMNGLGGRFEAIGAGAWSADLAARRSTDGQHWAPWIDERDDPYEHVFWSGQFARSCFAQFRAPRRTLRDVIDAQGSAVVAECLVRVRAANGVHALWQSSWHFDPEAGVWVVGTMNTYSVRATPIFY